MTDTELCGGKILEPFENNLLEIGFAIAIRVFEVIKVWRTRYVYAAFPRHHAVGKREAVGKNSALVVNAVTVRVFETTDPMGWIEQLFVGLVVRAGRIGDVQPALVIEAGADRPLDQGRTGDEFDFEAVGNGQRLAGEFEFSSKGERSQQKD